MALMSGGSLGIEGRTGKRGNDGSGGTLKVGGCAPLDEMVAHGIALIAPAEAGVASNGPAAAEPAAVSLEAA
jgi:hypothetical protein